MSNKVMAWVSEERWRSDKEKLVMLKLADCAADDGCCAFPTNHTLMVFAQFDSLRGLRKVIARLEKEGAIELEGWVLRDGRKRRSWRVVMGERRPTQTQDVVVSSSDTCHSVTPQEKAEGVTKCHPQGSLSDTHTLYITSHNITPQRAGAEETGGHRPGPSTGGSEAGQVVEKGGVGIPYWANKLPIQTRSWLDKSRWTIDRGAMTLRVRSRPSVEMLVNNVERFRDLKNAVIDEFPSVSRVNVTV